MVKSRKAISPILATLLLVVIAVAAIVVTYAWIMTYMNNAGQQAGVILYKANVYFYMSGTKKIDIDIGNSGTTDTKITTLYVGTSTSSLVNQTMTPQTLVHGGILRVTIDYNWTTGATYYFKVLAANGQSLDWPEQAPTT
jgi:flagellin-like protein